MPILVNGEIIPQELIREEERRLAGMAEWRVIPDALDKRMRLRETAEASVVDRVLLRQAADRDPRPVDPALVAEQVQRLTAAQSCRVLFDDGPLARQIEGQLRLQRQAFQRPEIVNAAHIVKDVDELHWEDEARAGIEAALAALERGEPFAQVADRYSDCKGNGGDLGSFERGAMVEEFEDVVFALKPGERSGIFRTPFGFHIAEVRSKTPGDGIAELSEARDTIEIFLMAFRKIEAERRAGERLRAQAEIRRISAREAQALSAVGRNG